LSDGAIDTMVECFACCPSPMAQLLIEHFHGAVTRVAVDATAFPHRRDGYNFLVLGEWREPGDTDRCIAWVRETYAAMHPFIGAGRYVNYLGDDESGDPVAAAYGPNYRRLQRIKAKYDPGNLFHMNQNIRPQS
jgi:FAD/FMN-containing dehydrogenase